MLIVHVLTVIIWIGGLAFVTMLIFPSMYRMTETLQKVLFFQRIEHRFAPLARIYAAITGLSGFGMLFYSGRHSLLFTRAGLFLTIMIIIWVLWVVMLFGLEPIIIRKMLDRMMKGDKKLDVDAVFKRMNLMHWILLAVSLTAAGSGIMFARGY